MARSRRDLLLSAAAVLGVPRVTLGASGAGTAAASDAKHLIVVYAEGGWDVTYCLDPKLSCTAPGGGACTVEGPEVDEDPTNPDDVEAIETFSGIPVVVNDAKRPAVREFFSKWASRCHVVNGIWTGSIAHIPCRYRMLTGRPDGRTADMATISGYVHGGALPLGAVDLSGWSILGNLASSAGRIGNQSQIAALLDGGITFAAPPEATFDYPLFAMDPSDEAQVEALVRARAEAFRARFGDGGKNDRAIDDLLTSIDRGQRFRAQSADILDALQIGVEATFRQQLGMTVDMLQSGLCQSVTIDTREPWDTHDANALQHGMYDRLFGGLEPFVQELADLGMLDRVVIAVVSEMTRTPLRNTALGKDHWAHTSALLIGAVRGGAVSGATDHQVESVEIDLATGAPSELGELDKYDNFSAGLLELAGVDPGEWLPGVTPFRGAHPG